MPHRAAQNAAHHHSSRSTSSFPSANCPKQNCNQKHRLGTLIRSAREGKATLQDSSPPQRRKNVQFVHSHQSTVAKHVSTVEPSIATTLEKLALLAIDGSPKSPLKAGTQRPNGRSPKNAFEKGRKTNSDVHAETCWNFGCMFTAARPLADELHLRHQQGFCTV